MPAPSPVGTSTTFFANSSGTTIQLAKPSGLQNGDFLVAALRGNSTNSTNDYSLSGWTRRGLAFVANDPAGRVIGLYTKPVTDAGSEPSTYTFTKSVADTRRAGSMMVVRGVDLTNPIAGQSTGYDAVPSPRIQLNSFSVDTTDPTLLVGLWGTEIVSPNATEPTIPFGTQQSLVASSSGTGATRTVLYVGTEVLSGSTTTGHKNLTWSAATGAAATGFILRGLDDTPPTPIGVPIKVGTGETAYLSVLNGAGTRVAPSSVRLYLPGSPNVSTMLSTPGVTWAHRGGSANWPEMSEYAYDRSVMRGFPVLEFSANPTSDNRWVGVHDASVNRTSQTTGVPDISTQTLAQVRAYQNSLNSAGNPRVYYLLEDMLDKYTPTHVVVADPKYGVGKVSQFLDLLDAHGGNTKIVVKFYGVGSGAVALANAATTRGYQTWGYFYESDYTSGDLATYQTHWSILGMNYDASQTAWDSVKSYGKPVVGHIVPNQAGYNTAIAKGATIVQCANVDGIKAVR